MSIKREPRIQPRSKSGLVSKTSLFSIVHPSKDRRSARLTVKPRSKVRKSAFKDWTITGVPPESG